MNETNPTMQPSNVETGKYGIAITTHNEGTDIVITVSLPVATGVESVAVSGRRISAAAFAEAYSEGVDLVKECKLVCVRELFDAILISSTEDIDADSN